MWSCSIKGFLLCNSVQCCAALLKTNTYGSFQNQRHLFKHLAPCKNWWGNCHAPCHEQTSSSTAPCWKICRCVLRKLVLNMCAFILLVAMSYELFSSIFSLVHFHIFCSSSEFPTGLADVGIRDQQLFLALRNPTTQAKCCPLKMCAGKKNKFSRENAFTKLSCDIYGVYQGFIIHLWETIVDKAVVKHALRLLGRSRKNLRKGRTLFDETISASAQNNLGNQINNQCICCTIRECTLRNPSCDWQNCEWERQGRVAQHEEKGC